MRIKLFGALCSVCIVGVLALCFVADTYSKEKSADSVVEVDKQIALLLDSKEYGNADFESQKTMMNNLFLELKRKKLIVGYSYFDNDRLFSYEYNDHSLGGIALKSFSAESGSPTMN